MPDKQKRVSLPSLLKIVAGVVLFVLSLWGIHWAQLIEALTTVNVAWLLVALISMAFSLFVKAYRWKVLLRNYGVEFSMLRVCEAFFIGLIVNLLTPARGGDIARIGILGMHQPKATVPIVATVAIEKFLDLLTLVLIALMVAAYLPPEGELWLREWLLPISGTALVGLLMIVAFGPKLWKRIGPNLEKSTRPWVLRGVGWINNFVESSLWLRDTSHLFPVLGITLVVWFSMWLNNDILFRSLALKMPLSAGWLVLVLGYVRMLLALPTSSVGPFYFFAQLSVTTFGVGDESALAFAILLHAIVTLTPIVVGGGLLLISDDARNLMNSVWKSNAAKTD